jgi:uncharacterized protein VirK/YbjX
MKTLVNIALHWSSGLPARSRKLWLAPQRLLAACRILAFPSKLRQLWSMKFMGQYFRAQIKRDTFFFLTHKYYLSKYFTLAQRIDCAIAHYRFEGQNCTPAYRRSVYQSPRGLTLWNQVVDGVRYSITLRATEDTRYEGDLSVCCFVDEARICRVSFSYVDRCIFGLPPQCAIFVTRNQTDQIRELQLFRSAFKQNSPVYFCIASVCGIAMANGMHAIFMVKADAQIAYAEQYAEGFRNSYSALWQQLGAQEIEGRHAYSMPVPLPLSLLAAVKHRSRAVARRRNWQEIGMCTRQTMLAYRVNRGPPPIGEEESDLQPLLDILTSGGTDPRRHAGRSTPNEGAGRHPA